MVEEIVATRHIVSLCDIILFFFLLYLLLFTNTLFQVDFFLLALFCNLICFLCFCLYPHMSNQEVEYVNCVISKTVVCWVIRHKWVTASED